MYIFFFWAQPGPCGGLDLANLHRWAGPSQPSLVTGPCQWPASLPHARVILYACMNSAKVITLPSHCSSSCLQYKNITKKRRNHRVIAALVSLHFLFFFHILNMHHLVIQELRRMSNVPNFEKTKMTVVLCYLLHRVLCFCSVWFLYSPFCFLNISLLPPISYVFP